MAASFRNSTGRSLELADRLVEALIAGDQAGGDRRGRQSAAVLVVKENGGYGGDNDRYLDLRVDDDSDPVVRLRELVGLHHLYFGKVDPSARLLITPELATELQQICTRAGRYRGTINGLWDQPAQEALWEVVGIENLEERWTPDDHPELIDPMVLNFLRDRYALT